MGCSKSRKFYFAKIVSPCANKGRVTFWSRSRQEYWRKGDTSGHAQYVKGARLDCDGDAVLVSVEQIGAACHTGDRTCFDANDLSPAEGAP